MGKRKKVDSKGNSNAKSAENLVDLETTNFQIRESYKSVRTNLMYSIIKKGCKKIAFTSAGKSEGKTVTSVNIGSAFAQQVDTKVLIVDCDLRRPMVHSALGLKPELGIANYLNDECELEDIIIDTRYENLKAVCYGAIPPNPSELLASNSMLEFIKAMEKEFDYIIFDTPPIGVVMDALPIFRYSDGVVVIVKHNSTTYPELKRTHEMLKRNDVKILGIVMNDVEILSSKKYSKYKKYKSGYGYYGYYGY